MNNKDIQERTQAMISRIAQREKKVQMYWVHEGDLTKFGERLLDLPTRTTITTQTFESIRWGRRNRTMLTHKCWFFKKPELNSITVEECIEKYPKSFIWAYENLAINWSQYIVQKMNEKYPWAVRKVNTFNPFTM